MTTPADLHAAVLAALDALPTVAAYDGAVPVALTHPAHADSTGRVYPYAVVWPSPGGEHDERGLCGPLTGMRWTVQVTVAAGTPTWCLQAVTVVRAALVGLQLVDATVSPLVDETPRSRLVTRDDDTTPPRWFVPLQFGCVTTT